MTPRRLITPALALAALATGLGACSGACSGGSTTPADGGATTVDSARADYTALGGLPPDEFYADSFTTEADKHKETA